MNSFLLPGGGFSPAPVQTPGSSRPTKWLRIVIIIWLVAGLVFVIWRLQPDIRPAAPPAASLGQSQRLPVTAISTEDLLQHMDDVKAKLEKAGERIRRAEEQISRTLPSIERNYLPVEKQHLNAALANSEIARHDLEECRQEFELVLNSLRKELQ